MENKFQNANPMYANQTSNDVNSSNVSQDDITSLIQEREKFNQLIQELQSKNNEQSTNLKGQNEILKEQQERIKLLEKENAELRVSTINSQTNSNEGNFAYTKALETLQDKVNFLEKQKQQEQEVIINSQRQEMIGSLLKNYNVRYEDVSYVLENIKREYNVDLFNNPNITTADVLFQSYFGQQAQNSSPTMISGNMSNNGNATTIRQELVDLSDKLTQALSKKYSK